MVSLKVYDILGEDAETLVNELKAPGKHSVMWDATWQASGANFYRLQPRPQLETQKMILLR